MSITALLQAQAAALPDKPFVLTDGGTYSYASIASLARRFCSQLRTAGIRPGDHVGVLADNSAAYVVAWFGINMAGAVAVTLNHQLIADGLLYTIEQSEVRLLVADRTFMDSRARYLTGAAADLPVVVIENEVAFLAALERQPEAKPATLASRQTCAIIYTSGTTGRPKGVMNCHEVYLAAGREVARLAGVRQDDVIMAVLPMFHANSQMFGVMPALTVGATLALRPKFSATSFFDDARRFGATGHPAVGTIVNVLLKRHPEGDRRHAMRFCIGGGVSGADDSSAIMNGYLERFGIRMYEAFGMTEIGGITCGNSVDDWRAGTNGRPRPDVEVAILDEEDHVLPPGVDGEIVVRPREPDVIFSGYWKKPEQTLESFRNLWFHTGDRGHFDADGYLYYRGRIKELIRRHGEMISPSEIEQRLALLPGVRECAVVGVPDAIAGEEIKAVVVLDEPRPATDIRDYLAAHFPPYMLPRYVELAPALEKTETEKVRRGAMQYLDARVVDLQPAAARHFKE
jgi:crotonobetaine/carnitine-CoA ligase